MIILIEQSTKSLNRESVLQNLLLSPEGLTQQELARKNKLTVASIGNILTELETKKLIQKSGLAISSGGRKPSIYQLDHSHYRTFSVSIGYGKLSCLLLSLQGTVIAKEVINFDVLTDPYIILDKIIDIFYKLIKDYEVSLDRILGLGISAPGPLDQKNGIIQSPPNLLAWKDVHAVDYLKSRIDLMIIIEKDANCMALSEYYYGNASEYNYFLFVMVDAGIGSSFFVKGEGYGGASQVAGEIGHGTIDLNGLKCNCGNYGCLEVMASGNAIVKKARNELRKGNSSMLSEAEHELTLDHILDGAAEQDELCRSLLLDSSRYVGIKLADKINFLNPDLVVLGGLVNEKMESYSEWVKEIAMNRIFQETAKGVKIKRAQYGEIGEGLGASTVILKSAFKRQ